MEINRVSIKVLSAKLFAVVLIVCTYSCFAQTYKFDFGNASVPAAAGYTKVTTSNLYTTTYNNDHTNGVFGFEDWDSTHLRALDRVNPTGLNRDIITGWNNNGFSSFYFSVRVPEGKYTVTFYIGDYGAAATTTIKGENRRLLVNNLQTAAGQIVTRTFTIMRRDSSIGNTALKVGLDDSYGRDFPPICLGWDHKLTFEFSGTRPCIGGLDIIKVDTGITLHLCGNSTLVEQEDEPWAAWGMFLPQFFNSSIIVNNLANSGNTSSGFINQNRLRKICSVMKPGDFLFFEFGHNDSKPNGVSQAQFQANMKTYYDSATAHGATMVFVTPTARHADNDSSTSIGNYAQLTRTYAKTLTGAKLIDLNAAVIHMKNAFATAAYGSDNTQIYCYAPVSPLWPDLPTGASDDTHFCDFGGHELAKWVARTGMKAAGLGLTKYLLDSTAFNPNTPDLKSSFTMPYSLDTLYRHPKHGATVRADSVFAVTVSVSTHNNRATINPISINCVFSRINYTSNVEGSAEFVVYSSSGKVLTQKNILVQKSGSFDWKELNSLSPGMYFLQMKINNTGSDKTRFCKS